MKVVQIVKRGWFSDTVRLEAEIDERFTQTDYHWSLAYWRRYRIDQGKFTTVKLPQSMNLQTGDAISLEKLVQYEQTHGLWFTCGNGEVPDKD